MNILSLSVILSCLVDQIEQLKQKCDMEYNFLDLYVHFFRFSELLVTLPPTCDV